jgi:ATP-dependent Lhr-like helicase
MGKTPPHILVTTPESLYILMTAEKSRAAAHHAHHDRRRDSRHGRRQARLASGAHPGTPGRAHRHPRPQRIGLSATVKPIEEVAQFLGPQTRIVNVGHRRDMDLAVLVPRDELGPIATHEMWAEIYDRLAELIRAHRTTLVFVNTRRMSERIAHALGGALGADAVLPHHGSLARERCASTRKRAEERRPARRGGDGVARTRHRHRLGGPGVQIGSTRSIAVALQRFGRSGHWVGARPKGRLSRYHARRTDRVRRPGARHRRANWNASHSRKRARYSGAADRRHRRRARTGAKTPCSAHAHRVALSQSPARRLSTR